MHIEQALEIRKLLNLRDELMIDLRDYESCILISGQICDTANGLGFRWEKGSRQIQYLIDGINKDIDIIENTILEMKGE